MRTERMIIDEQLSVYDEAIAEHLVVAADPPTTLETARQLDFLTVRAPLLDAAMWVRDLPDRVRHRASPLPPKLTLADGVSLPGWMSLGQRDGVEVAFGAVGKFWQSSIEWRDVPTSEFATFADPGWGKIACNFTVRPYGKASTLLTYECRTATTDLVSRRRFARYWWLIRPIVGHIMRATLATIAANAVQRPGELSPSNPSVTSAG